MSLAVEHLTPRVSLFARFDARWKLAALVLAAFAAAALRSTMVLAAALALALFIAAVARVPGRWFRLRLGVVLFSLMPFFFLLPLTIDRGGPSKEILGLRLSADGLIVACELTCRTLAIVTLMLVLLASAPLHVTLRAARCLYVPGLLVQLMLLSYRYVFLLLDELNRLRIAVRVRGFRGLANRHSYRTISRVAGTLLVRGAERAERVSQAMRCRGFDGNFRTLDEFQTTWRDVALFTVIVGAFAGLVVWDRWM
jgi:cobalt/nickel transport system permease protein